MAESTEPIGAPAIRRTEERTYTGPAGWSVPTRARDLALVLSVTLVELKVAVRPAGTLERVTVRADGDVRRLDRYWRRLDEVADAAQRSVVSAGTVGRRARRWTLRSVLGELFSSS